MDNDKHILYSCEESEKINQLIQTKIASHLFLTCNYAPSPYLVQSEDAKFVVGILNLYKFVIDGSIIDKIPYIIDANMGIIFNKNEFKDKIDVVKALRTVYCHNESEISGNDHDIKVVNAWMKQIPKTVDDYGVLNQQLQRLASDIIAVLYQFVEDASRVKQKAVLIENWENIISRFYQRPSTKNILEGQLKKFYIARKGILNMDRYTNLDMMSCVREYYIGDIERKLAKKESCYNMLCRKCSLSAETQATLKAQVKEVEDELKERKKQIIEKLRNNRTNIDNIDRSNAPYLELYMKELPQKIIKLIGDTSDTNIYGTLLPQDIVQYIVKQDFNLIIRK